MGSAVAKALDRALDLLWSSDERTRRLIDLAFPKRVPLVLTDCNFALACTRCVRSPANRAANVHCLRPLCGMAGLTHALQRCRDLSHDGI